MCSVRVEPVIPVLVQWNEAARRDSCQTLRRDVPRQYAKCHALVAAGARAADAGRVFLFCLCNACAVCNYNVGYNKECVRNALNMICTFCFLFRGGTGVWNRHRDTRHVLSNFCTPHFRCKPDARSWSFKIRSVTSPRLVVVNITHFLVRRLIQKPVHLGGISDLDFYEPSFLHGRLVH